MKRILIIDDSSLFREYLQKKLEEFGFDVITAINGLEGSNKIRSQSPDLIITDFTLSRKEIFEVLKEKDADPNTRHIPIVMISNKIQRDRLMEIAKYNVRKFLNKPLKVDLLLEAVGEILGQPLVVDETPCIMEAHMNDNILFLELAQGLNKEKISLLEFKIDELLKLYHVRFPKILLMISDLNIKTEDHYKLNLLFDVLTKKVQGFVRNIKVLSTNPKIKDFLNDSKEFQGIAVFTSLDQAMDGLLDRKQEGAKNPEAFIQAQNSGDNVELDIRLEKDEINKDSVIKLSNPNNQLTFAVVDDDFIVQEIVKNTFSNTLCEISTFDNGEDFLDNFPLKLDLIFLDLMMPQKNGFEVLEALRRKG
jgi:CheY-like chemotaxis protein